MKKWTSLVLLAILVVGTACNTSALAAIDSAQSANSVVSTQAEGANPNTTTSKDVVDTKPNDYQAKSAHGQPAQPKITEDTIKARVEQLSEKLSAAKASGDEVKAQMLEDAINQLEETLRASAGLN